MEYKEAYQEYCREHPDELKALNTIKARSTLIEIQRHRRRQEKLEYIEQCRRELYGRK